MYSIAPTDEIENDDVHSLFEIGIVICEKIEYLEDCYDEYLSEVNNEAI
jgi:hypothetical protein